MKLGKEREREYVVKKARKVVARSDKNKCVSTSDAARGGRRFRKGVLNSACQLGQQNCLL